MPNVIGENLKGDTADADEGGDAEEEEEEEEEDMDVDCHNDETNMYSLGDAGDGRFTSSDPLPKVLSKIEKIGKNLFKGHQAYSHFFMEGDRVESKRELVHLLNQRVKKKNPSHSRQTERREMSIGRKRNGGYIFSYNPVVKLLTHKRTLSHKCLGLSSYLSYSINRRC